MLLLLSAAAFSYVLLRRGLQESSLALILGSGYAVVCVLLLALANIGANPTAAALILFGLSAGLQRWGQSTPLEPLDLSRGVKATLLASGCIIVAYTNLSMNLFPDDDFWIHFPLQGLLAVDGLPVRHPFFSEIEMHGHYGRDLLIATVASHAHLSILQSLFWQTTLTQVASLLIIVGLVRRSSGSQLSATLAALFIFFGINVGGRGGLLDCYQNNNALAYMLTLSILHLFHLVLLKPGMARVLTASVMLGTLAIVYETHFGLLGLVLLAGLTVTRRKELALVGVLALTMALVQGGPLTALLQDKLHPVEREWTPGELNQHQIIKLTFPKRELFQIQLAYGDYQRRSLVYLMLPDLGPISAIAPGTPYRPVWSWDVLKIHWLATLLAPWSLFTLLKRRPRDPVGLAFWTFGAFSYLTPALVHFGPIYEFEYFRWQFAAGFGFAGALGIATGLVLEAQPPKRRWVTLFLLILVNVLPMLSIFLPRLGFAAQAQGRLRDLLVPRSETAWVLAHQADLGGFGYQDLKAAYYLREASRPGQRVMVNSPHSRALDIHYDSTLSALSGRRSVGHSLPWPQEPVGTPPFHQAAPARVFWKLPSVELLEQLQIDWILLRPVPKVLPSMRRWLNENCELAWVDGDFRLYSRRSQDGARRAKGLGPPTERIPILHGLPNSQVTDELIEFELAPDGHLWGWGIVEAGAGPDTLDTHEMVVGRGGRSGVVTPPVDGEFELIFLEIEDGRLRPSPRHHRIRVEERKEERDL